MSEDSNENTPLLLSASSKTKRRKSDADIAEEGYASSVSPASVSTSSMTQEPSFSFDLESKNVKLCAAVEADIGFHRVIRQGILSGEKGSLYEPAAALSPLVAGGKIVLTDGSVIKPSRPNPLVKSTSVSTPQPRTARHFKFHLYQLNNFRHQYKNTRLAIKLAGMAMMISAEWDKMKAFTPLHDKSLGKMQKIMKHIGQGGNMKDVLRFLHPFSNTLRVTMLVLRTIEVPHFRRLEVGLEETMGLIGNRFSHHVAKAGVDYFVAWPFLPANHFIFKNKWLPMEWWFPVALCILFGFIRAVSPYCLSFQGSRLGRVLSRQFYMNVKHRWLPIQRVENFHEDRADTIEQVEASENADLFKVANKAVKALHRARLLGLDGVKGQVESLSEEGFRLVGFGSGGYAAYLCHISGSSGSIEPVLLHVTPYSPSVMDTMPHYIVIEKQDSQDYRAAWFKTIAKHRWVGPALLEGYEYQGAFFSPHVFAEMRKTYHEMVTTYNMACENYVDPKTGKQKGPPTDEASLKKFLHRGMVEREQKQQKQAHRVLQKDVAKVAKKLKNMMNNKNGDTAPLGVILYVEGLSCSRKLSTGGLIQQVFNEAGYTVEVRQYNSPTEEQRRHPWMDRFQVPDTLSNLDDNDGGESGGMSRHHDAVVWNRGPAGDFVYGSLANAPESEKRARYQEFKAFDRDCFKNNTLFIKLFFVTNVDSIAHTLGEHLGKLKISEDLRLWITTCYGEKKADEIMKNFDIRLHRDPKAFQEANNKYLPNLEKFTDFVSNTDSDANPWVVVDTADAYLASKQLLQVFSAQLDAYACVQCPDAMSRSWLDLLCQRDAVMPGDLDSFGIEVSKMVRKVKKRMAMASVLALSGLIILCYLFFMD